MGCDSGSGGGGGGDIARTLERLKPDVDVVSVYNRP